MTLQPSDYTAFFTPGRTFAMAGGMTGTVSVVPAGDLRLDTGRLIACDPLSYVGDEGFEPFTVTVPPGSYPVVASVVTLSGDAPEHRRVAAARLTARDVPPAAWEMAVVRGQDPAELKEGHYFGYGVDAGLGCFMDEAANRAFPYVLDERPEWLWSAMASTGDSAVPFIATDPASGQSLAAFSSGWGDGAYPTWIGRDATGEVACFVTDFLVLPAPGSD
jgi:hypothetical protein